MSPKVSPRVAFLSAVSFDVSLPSRSPCRRSLAIVVPGPPYTLLWAGLSNSSPGSFGDVHPRVERVQERTAPAPAQASPAVDRAPPGGAASVLVLFIAASFLSAFLLFSVEPLFAKMVLPVLGGSPSVWAVALFFFQAALLAGYGYAHLLMRYVPAPATGFVHIAIALAGARGAADRVAERLDRAAAGRALLLAARPFRRRRRPALRRRRRQRAAAAGLVCAHRPSARARSLLPLRRLQPRQPHRAARLSVPVRAGVGPQGAEPRSGRSFTWC